MEQVLIGISNLLENVQRYAREYREFVVDNGQR